MFLDPLESLKIGEHFLNNIMTQRLVRTGQDRFLLVSHNFKYGLTEDRTAVTVTIG